MFPEAARSASHEQLAARIVERAPRVLALWGPAGYDKRAFLRVYARSVGRLIACDLDPRRNRDLARAILDSVVARDRSRAVRMAADRLAQRPDRPFGTAREALRHEWPLADGPELLVVRDATGALSTPAGLDVLGELIATLPAERTVALTTRAPLPPALEQLVEREHAQTIEPYQLALSPESVRELCSAAGLGSDVAEAVNGLTEGWPLVVRLIMMWIERDGADAVLRAAAEIPRAALLAYAGHRVVAALDPRIREAVAAAVVRPGATADDLVRVLGEGFDDTLLFRLWKLPFVTPDDDRTFVHPEIAALLRSRFAPLVQSLYERTVGALVGDGAYSAGARVALENRDPERAAALLDAAPPYTIAPFALSDYERVLDRIDRDLITRYPNMWMATIPFRRFSVDRDTYVREAETVYFCLPYSVSPDKRAAALTHLASAYFQLGRVAECDALIESALGGFAAEPTPVRASLLNFSALLRGEQGRFDLARALAREAAAISNQEFSENLALHHIDAYEAIICGRYERVRVIFDELLRRQSRDELPLYFAYSATDGAFWAWVYGDDESFARYLSTLEDALSPGLEAGFARMIDAAHGRPIPADDAYAWPVQSAMAHFYRLGYAADRAEALDAARAAARAADERSDPGLQVLAHAALYVLDEAGRSTHREKLDALAQGVESPELQAAVRGLLAGRDAGILEPFISRRIAGRRDERAPKLAVELFSARINRSGAAVRLSDKELELIALLASTYGPLSRDRIGEALWDHLDPEEWGNNLKVTLSRLRTKLAMKDAVTVTDGNYRLSRDVDVDLRRYESIVRDTGRTELDERSRAALESVLEAYRAGSIARYERFAWMQPALARISDVVCTAGLILAGDALAAQRYDDARAFARTVTGVDPLNERACETLMKVELARGDAAAARREFRRYAAALETELGGKPPARLSELARSAP